jgi:hypothetical protein
MYMVYMHCTMIARIAKEVCQYRALFPFNRSIYRSLLPFNRSISRSLLTWLAP